MPDYLNPQIKLGGEFPAGVTTPNLRPLSDILAENEEHRKLPYTPRAQFLPFHNRKQRFAMIVAHRRAGKTVATINDDIRKLIRLPIKGRAAKPPQIAFISPTYAMGKRNAWRYAKYYSSKIHGAKVSESDLSITFTDGRRYLFAGSDNYDSLRGIYLDHATLDEFGFQEPAVWGSVIRSTLSDFNGTATFIGSANGRNHFYQLLKQSENDPNWLIMILKASQTGLIPKEELEEIKKTITSEQYLQEYECSFDAAVKGAYYGKEIMQAEDENRIRHIPYDRNTTVYAGWDLGIADHTAIWIFQIVGNEYHFINYYHNYSEPLGHYIDWIKSLPYKVDLHYLPHDALAREEQTGKNRQEFLENHDFETEIVPKHKVQDGIAACRVVFNRCYFDKKNCDKGIDCLRMYESKFSEKDQVLQLKAHHNWASHGADAFRYGIMGVEEKKKAYMQEEDFYHGENSWLA